MRRLATVVGPVLTADMTKLPAGSEIGNENGALREIHFETEHVQRLEAAVAQIGLDRGSLLRNRSDLGHHETRGIGKRSLRLGEVPDLVRRSHFESHHSGLWEPLGRASDWVLAPCRRAGTGPAGQSSEGSSPLVPSQMASRRRTNKSTSCGSSPSRSADT
jgi:hypothetical protein